MKQNVPQCSSFRDALQHTHLNVYTNVLSSLRKRAFDAPRERISRDAPIERVFQKRGGFFAQETARAIAPSAGNARSNANERTEIGEPLFLSFLRSHAVFRILCNKTSSLLRRFTRFTRRRRRRQMCVCSKGENNARIRFTLKTTDLSLTNKQLKTTESVL